MTDPSFSNAQAASILDWLDVPPPSASRRWLDALLAAWGQRVPWESASRIVRRARHRRRRACVNGPAAFWQAAMTHGLGGTCFETNAALAALLEAAGIPSVFTLNDRPPHVACHTALIVEAEGERLVVDAGFPLYAAVPLPVAGEIREARTPWGTFSAARVRGTTDRYEIGQHPHPRPLAFELVDRVVARHRYDAATCADYGRGGLFLDRVIIKKIVGGRIWRFASGDVPCALECFRDGIRETQPLPDDADALAVVLASHFALDAATVRLALRLARRC